MMVGLIATVGEEEEGSFVHCRASWVRAGGGAGDGSWSGEGFLKVERINLLIIFPN